MKKHVLCVCWRHLFLSRFQISLCRCPYSQVLYGSLRAGLCLYASERTTSTPSCLDWNKPAVELLEVSLCLESEHMGRVGTLPKTNIFGVELWPGATSWMGEGPDVSWFLCRIAGKHTMLEAVVVRFFWGVGSVNLESLVLCERSTEITTVCLDALLPLAIIFALWRGRTSIRQRGRTCCSSSRWRVAPKLPPRGSHKNAIVFRIHGFPPKSRQFFLPGARYPAAPLEGHHFMVTISSSKRTRKIEKDRDSSVKLNYVFFRCYFQAVNVNVCFSCS